MSKLIVDLTETVVLVVDDEVATLSLLDEDYGKIAIDNSFARSTDIAIMLGSDIAAKYGVVRLLTDEDGVAHKEPAFAGLGGVELVFYPGYVSVSTPNMSATVKL